MKRLPLVLLALVALLTGCNRRPDMVLGRDEMAHVLTDLEITAAYALDQSPQFAQSDSMPRRLRAAILDKHGVTEEQLDSSLRWYGRHLPEFLKVCDQMDSILADSLRNIDSSVRVAAVSAAGDSINLWTMEPSMAFRSGGRHFLAFSIDCDTTWHRGDVLEWSLSSANALSPLTMVLGVDYLNRAGTTESVRDVLHPGDIHRLKLTLQLERQYQAKRVWGWIRLAPMANENAFVDSITLVRTREVKDDYSSRRRTIQRINRHDTDR